MLMQRTFLVLVIFVLIVALSLPVVVLALPYGGLIYLAHFCYNGTIFAGTGPPRGGPFIYTPFTRLYSFGPPTHAGQWHLGLAGPPYFCLASRLPFLTWSGLTIIMMGSSR